MQPRFVPGGRSLIAGAAAAALLQTGCASLLGADFDHPAATDGGLDASSCSGEACGAADAAPDGDAASRVDGASHVDAEGSPADWDASSGIVVFGGLESGNQDDSSIGETEVWNGSIWTPVSVPSPSARYGHAMATLGASAVLFGGINAVVLGDTWVWSGVGWTEQSVAGPGARWSHAMAALHDAVVLFGGDDGKNDLGDTWVWNGATWTPENVPGPTARCGHAMAALGDTVVLFGGTPYGCTYGGTVLGDTWVWDGSSWTQQDVPGPSARWGHAMATIGNSVVLFGGASEKGLPLSDTWVWDGATWTEQGPSGPPARAWSAMTTWNASIVLFGGTEEGVYTFNDTWIWSGSGWLEDTQGTAVPDARSYLGIAAW